jgi:hypothetical protein
MTKGSTDLFFYDLNVTIKNGLKFTASGLVDTKASENYPNCGQDYSVRYINPFGDVCHDWRDASEIKTYTVEQRDFIMLELEISELYQLKSANWT